MARQCSSTFIIAYVSGNPSKHLQYPTDFSIHLHNASNGTERVKYAHIVAEHAGVFTPPVLTPDDIWVPFDVKLEPLAFGVLPLSVRPILLCLAMVLLGAALVTPKIHAVLAKIALEARKEQVLKSLKRS